MACFVVSAAEAVVVTGIRKHAEAKEHTETVEQREVLTEHKIPFSRKLKWLSGLLWGGSGLLAFEHVWHGEVAPWFPFLTAMSNPGDLTEMFHEMATVGVGMAVLVTAVWGIMCVVADTIVGREPESVTVHPQ